MLRIWFIAVLSYFSTLWRHSLAILPERTSRLESWHLKLGGSDWACKPASSAHTLLFVSMSPFSNRRILFKFWDMALLWSFLWIQCTERTNNLEAHLFNWKLGGNLCNTSQFPELCRNERFANSDSVNSSSIRLLKTCHSYSVVRSIEEIRKWDAFMFSDRISLIALAMEFLHHMAFLDWRSLWPDFLSFSSYAFCINYHFASIQHRLASKNQCRMKSSISWRTEICRLGRRVKMWELWLSSIPEILQVFSVVFSHISRASRPLTVAMLWQRLVFLKKTTMGFSTFWTLRCTATSIMIIHFGTCHVAVMRVGVLHVYSGVHSHPMYIFSALTMFTGYVIWDTQLGLYTKSFLESGFLCKECKQRLLAFLDRLRVLITNAEYKWLQLWRSRQWACHYVMLGLSIFNG